MSDKKVRAGWIIRLINDFGGTRAVANICQCKDDYIYQWYTEIPARAAWKLLAHSVEHNLGFTAEQIRPDNFEHEDTEQSAAE